MAKNGSGQDMRSMLSNMLSNMEFPANKQGIISYAKSKNAPQEVMAALNGIPDREYADMEELMREIESR